MHTKHESFHLLMTILVDLFNNHPISETDFSTMIHCMRQMNRDGEYTVLCSEQTQIVQECVGIDKPYNPFDFMERLRVACMFDKSSDDIAMHVNQLKCMCFE